MNWIKRLIYSIGKAIAQDEPQVSYRSLLKTDRAIKIQIAEATDYHELLQCEAAIRKMLVDYKDLEFAALQFAKCLRNRCDNKLSYIASGIHIDCSQLTLN